MLTVTLSVSEVINDLGIWRDLRARKRERLGVRKREGKGGEERERKGKKKKGRTSSEQSAILSGQLQTLPIILQQ